MLLLRSSAGGKLSEQSWTNSVSSNKVTGIQSVTPWLWTPTCPQLTNVTLTYHLTHTLDSGHPDFHMTLGTPTYLLTYPSGSFDNGSFHWGSTQGTHMV